MKFDDYLPEDMVEVPFDDLVPGTQYYILRTASYARRLARPPEGQRRIARKFLGTFSNKVENDNDSAVFINIINIPYNARDDIDERGIFRRPNAKYYLAHRPKIQRKMEKSSSKKLFSSITDDDNFGDVMSKRYFGDASGGRKSRRRKSRRRKSRRIKSRRRKSRRRKSRIG